MYLEPGVISHLDMSGILGQVSIGVSVCGFPEVRRRQGGVFRMSRRWTWKEVRRRDDVFSTGGVCNPGKIYIYLPGFIYVHSCLGLICYPWGGHRRG